MPYFIDFFAVICVLFLSMSSINLSKKAISISLLLKKRMNYLLGMKKKHFVKLNIGLERILSFLLLAHNAPAQYSKQRGKNDR